MPPSHKPKPRSSRGIVIVLLILLAATAAALWVLRETLDKGGPSLPSLFPSSNGSATADAAAEKPLAPPSLPGLSGTTVPAAREAEPAVPESPPTANATTPAAQAEQTPAPPVSQNGTQVLMPFSAREGVPASPPSGGGSGGDAMLPQTFVDDVAVFLVENFWPGGTHPSARSGSVSTVSLKWANLRYGAEFRGLTAQGGDTPRIRAAILEYALNPATVDRLCATYADSFISAFGKAAATRRVGPAGQERGLSRAEQRDLFTLYAAQARSLAAALRAYVGDGAMPGRVEELLRTEQEVYAANLVYLDSMAEYERARDAGNRNAIATAQRAMDAAAKAYQQRIQARGRAEAALETAMAASPAARALGNDSLVYAAAWAHRRGEAGIPALRRLAECLDNTAARLVAAKP